MATQQHLSGYLGTLNDQQAEALDLMREKTKHLDYVQNHPEGDTYLLRFLRATMALKKSKRIFHVEDYGGGKQGAMDRITKAVEFFERVKITEEPEHWAEFESKVRPWRYWFDERQRCLVMNLKIGEFLSTVDATMYTADQWEALIAHGFYRMECMAQQAREKFGLGDGPALMGIQDVSGVGGRATAKNRHLFLKHNEIAGQHFPEFLRKAFVVNAPAVFAAVWSVLKRIIDPGTVAKIEILRNPVPRLLNVFDPENLAAQYGGKGENVAKAQRVDRSIVTATVIREVEATKAL